MMLAEFKNFSIDIHDRNIIDSLNAKFQKGLIYSIVGRNGAGKTQILMALARLASAGTKFSGELLTEAKVGYVFQSPMLFPWLTVYENLTLTAPNQGDHILRYLDAFKMSQYKDFYPYQISGGTKQKVNIIRAFLSDASLILMDEIFVALDLPQKNDLISLVSSMWNKDKTIVFVTHDIDEALTLSHRILFLSKKKKNFTQQWNIESALPRSLEEIRKSDWAQNIYLELKSLLERDLLDEE